MGKAGLFCAATTDGRASVFRLARPLVLRRGKYGGRICRDDKMGHSRSFCLVYTYNERNLRTTRSTHVGDWGWLVDIKKSRRKIKFSFQAVATVDSFCPRQIPVQKKFLHLSMHINIDRVNKKGISRLLHSWSAWVASPKRGPSTAIMWREKGRRARSWSTEPGTEGNPW